MTQDADLEIRVLSGRHAGARAPAAPWQTLAPGLDGDIVLSDLDLAENLIGLQLMGADGLWQIRHDGPDKQFRTEHAQEGNAPGDIVWVGGVAISVAATNSPWPALQPHVPAEAAASSIAATAIAKAAAARKEKPSAQTSEATAAERLEPAGRSAVPATAQANAPHLSAQMDGSHGLGATRSSMRLGRMGWLLALMTAAVALAVMVALLVRPHAPIVTPGVESAAAASNAESAAQHQRMLTDIQLAIAAVDPGLRLKVAMQPDGRARVSGWVNSVEQLDLLAGGLSKIQPSPAMSVRTGAELRDDLRAALPPGGEPLDFELLGAGRVEVSGVALTTADRDAMLASLSGRIPSGLELVDGIRVAETQAGPLQAWLRSAGYLDATARWDGRNIVVEGLALTARERPRLEALLATQGKRFAGIPFLLKTQDIGTAVAADEPLVPASQAPFSFRIRSVVGGPAAYLVLDDGSKLQPGGSRAGWRLLEVQTDRLIFDGPRRLALAR